MGDVYDLVQFSLKKKFDRECQDFLNLEKDLRVVLHDYMEYTNLSDRMVLYAAVIVVAKLLAACEREATDDFRAKIHDYLDKKTDEYAQKLSQGE